MDEEFTGDYQEACGQCGSVAWALSEEGRFFCKSCHNVIERAHVVDTVLTAPGTARVSTMGRVKNTERRRQWVACEGFQFILMKQAAALIMLGVPPSFKDDVLWPLWRRFLQMSKQAYTDHPDESAKFQVQVVDKELESGAESSFLSASETDGETCLSSPSASQADSHSDWSIGSQSIDAHSTPRRKSRRGNMRMTETLALIHLALVWSRQALTLGDLLKLANDGHIPYVHAYQDLPEEMRLDCPEALIFTVQSIPTHQELHRKAQTLVSFLQLPAFPPIRHQDPLHPAMLSLRYLVDANLPDELHPWVCMLMERSGMADMTCVTSEPSSHAALPRYDVQAAALIIVAIKLLFGLDDRTEWDLSNGADKLMTEERTSHRPGSVFSLRRWYRQLHAAKLQRQRERDGAAARKQWKATPLYPSRKLKYVVMKKRRMAEQLALCLERLSQRSQRAPPAAPSSFTFCWGAANGTDGPSLRHHRLDAVVSLKQEVLTPVNTAYRHLPLASCHPRACGASCTWTAVEATLSRSFLWLLQLFCFLLQVSQADLHQEVMKIERRLLSGKTKQTTETNRGAS
ncbi:TATA box-binding protein-associated factor RNA polymerase I subunit B isoform X1 [Syngnathus typhle]|uniref:TATA box-binding protein-associated factor RNA polymerase I subunit B isoform X1 n=1 Tax=Syngnathus typhle TaxID=161592 RepID=UPI002A6A4864|nr:TATA box-binding protein-associated factor RNA polymerase I subunit B isoform X1 [Syngnathus typhle]